MITKKKTNEAADMKISEPNVKPIKTIMELRRWEKELSKNGPQKIHAYFRLGLDTGMLPSILQQLKWEDLKVEEEGNHLKQTKVYFNVPSKTEWNKPFRKIYLPQSSITILDKLRQNNPDDIYLFQSRSPSVSKTPNPLTVQRITVELKKAAVNCGIISENEPLGVMTLRQCFGYHHIVHGNWSVHEMMRYLEAHSLNSTKKYLCLPDDVRLGATPRNRKPQKE